MAAAPQEIAIGPAQPATLKAASALIAAGFERTIAADLDSVGRVAFRMYVAERSIAARLAGGALGLVAVEAGIVVAYAEVQGRGRQLAGRDHLSLLFVAPARQRRGIGRRMLAEIVRQTSALPRSPRSLSVHAAPSAVPAYRRLGFRPTGPIVRQDGLRFMPMVLRLGWTSGGA